MEQMPCSATTLELLTDAGTKAWPPAPRSIDDRADEAYEREVEYEALRELAVTALAVAIEGART